MNIAIKVSLHLSTVSLSTQSTTWGTQPWTTHRLISYL